MSDDRTMPMSSNLAHVRTSAIDYAAAAAAKKPTAVVQRAYKHPGLKDISRIPVPPFPSSINPSEAATQLTRSVKASASDIVMICNDCSYKGLSSTDRIPGCEYLLKKSSARAIAPDKPTAAPRITLMDEVFLDRCRAPSQLDRRDRRRSRPS